MINITLWVLRIMDPHTPWKNQWPASTQALLDLAVFFKLVFRCREGHWEVKFSNRSLMDLDGFSIKFDGFWMVFHWFFWILDGTSLIFLQTFESPFHQNKTRKTRFNDVPPCGTKSPMWPLPSVREIPNPMWVKRSEDFCWLRASGTMVHFYTPEN